MPGTAPTITVYLDHVHFIKDATVIELPRPILGDQREVIHNMVRATLPQGGLILSDGIWGYNEYRIYTFRTIKLADKILFEDFVRDNIGSNIQFRDMENVVHNVLLLEMPTFIVLRSRNTLDPINCPDDIIDYEFTVRLLKI